MRPGAYSLFFRMHTTSLGFDDVSDLSLRNSTIILRLGQRGLAHHLTEAYIIYTSCDVIYSSDGSSNVSGNRFPSNCNTVNRKCSKKTFVVVIVSS